MTEEVTVGAVDCWRLAGNGGMNESRAGADVFVPELVFALLQQPLAQL